MTAPSRLPAKTPGPRRTPALPPLAFPVPAPGEASCVGYGNRDTYRMLDGLVGSRGVRVRFNEGIIEKILAVENGSAAVREFRRRLAEKK